MIRRAVEVMSGLTKIVWLAILAVVGIVILFALFALGQRGAVEEPVALPSAQELADSLPLVEPPAPGNERDVFGDWVVSESLDPMDDSPRVFAMLDAQNQDIFSDITLIARCSSNRTEVYVDWDDYLADDRQSVAYRFPPSSMRQERWGVSTDNTATFAPRPIALLREMIVSQQLVMRTTPYNEVPVTAIFDLTGARHAIGQVAEACSWELENQ